jgi:hypothetical protein
LYAILLVGFIASAQEKPPSGNFPSQAQMKKMMEQQMKKAGMKGSPTAEYKKMMEGMMATPGDEVGFDFY